MSVRDASEAAGAAGGSAFAARTAAAADAVAAADVVPAANVVAAANGVAAADATDVNAAADPAVTVSTPRKDKCGHCKLPMWTLIDVDLRYFDYANKLIATKATPATPTASGRTRSRRPCSPSAAPPGGWEARSSPSWSRGSTPTAGR